MTEERELLWGYIIEASKIDNEYYTKIKML